MVRFPSVTAYSLAKTRIALPQELSGLKNLLVLSFDPSQNGDVQKWLDAAQKLEHLHLGFGYYLLPVSNHQNQLYRWWENSSMRSSISDPELWPRVVPLYVDKQKFLKDLAIDGDKQIVILLTDKQGGILWRSTGALTPAKQAALQAQVQH